MAVNKNRRGRRKRKVASGLGKDAASPRVSPETLVSHLIGSLPERLAQDLVEQFMAIRREVFTCTLVCVSLCLTRAYGRSTAAYGWCYSHSMSSKRSKRKEVARWLRLH